MTPKLLKLLAPTGRRLVDQSFCSDIGHAPDFEDYIVPCEIGREIDLGALSQVLREVFRRFPKRALHTDKDESDAWLAPRLHACLRLTRREASDHRIWDYLSVVAFHDYVRWRWPGRQGVTPRVRFIGHQSINAFARLWWGAELVRNGKDYSLVERAFANSRWAVTWLPLDLVHHRPTALASVRFLEANELTVDQIDKLAKSFNLLMTTLSLESITSSSTPDAHEVRAWIKQSPDWTTMMSSLPEGPDEEPIAESELETLTETLVQLADDLNLGTYVRKRESSMG